MMIVSNNFLHIGSDHKITEGFACTKDKNGRFKPVGLAHAGQEWNVVKPLDNPKQAPTKEGLIQVDLYLLQRGSDIRYAVVKESVKTEDDGQYKTHFSLEEFAKNLRDAEFTLDLVVEGVIREVGFDESYVQYYKAVTPRSWRSNPL